MPEMTKEFRTIMYSVVGGKVVVHKFPFNANEKYGMAKLEKFVKRGFTFIDPRKPTSPNIPEVIVTGVVDLAKPVLTGQNSEMGTGIETTEEKDGKTPPLASPAVLVGKKWRNMNAQERKSYQEKKKEVKE